MKAPFGWTVVRKGGTDKIVVYKRDCPADAVHFASDLAPFTHSTKAKAIAAGKRGEYAYKCACLACGNIYGDTVVHIGSEAEVRERNFL